MKKRLFKIAVVILLSFSIYTTFHVADTKCAKAAYCPWQYIDPTVVGGAIANFGAALVQNFYDGVLDFLESYVETKEEEMEETEENLESVAREERLGEVEQGKQLANIAEASVALKKVTEQQVDEYNSIARDFPAPSDQTCFNTNASIQLARADRHAEFKKAVLRERDRHRDGKTVGSRASRGPVILNRVLKEGSQENCLKGEQKGSTDAFCENETDEATADLHKQPSALFTNGATITPEMEDAADLAEEMINPTLKAGPFPQAIKNDPATQAAYMEAKRQEAIYNTSGEVLRDLRARAMPIEGDCEASKKMVKEVFRRRYGNDYVAGIGDGCPSVATIEKAEALRLTNSADMAETITDANGNVYQSDLYLASLDLRQGFDAYQRELDLTLTTVIDKLQERQYADAPIGSIGQSRRGGDVVIDPPGRPGGPGEPGGPGGGVIIDPPGGGTTNPPERCEEDYDLEDLNEETSISGELDFFKNHGDFTFEHGDWSYRTIGQDVQLEWNIPKPSGSDFGESSCTGTYTYWVRDKMMYSDLGSLPFSGIFTTENIEEDITIDIYCDVYQKSCKRDRSTELTWKSPDLYADTDCRYDHNHVVKLPPQYSYTRGTFDVTPPEEIELHVSDYALHPDNGEEEFIPDNGEEITFTWHMPALQSCRLRWRDGRKIQTDEIVSGSGSKTLKTNRREYTNDIKFSLDCDDEVPQCEYSVVTRVRWEPKKPWGADVWDDIP